MESSFINNIEIDFPIFSAIDDGLISSTRQKFLDCCPECKFNSGQVVGADRTYYLINRFALGAKPTKEDARRHKLVYT